MTIQRLGSFCGSSGASAATRSSRASDAFEKVGEFEEVEFGGAEFAGRDVDIGDACASAVARDCGQVVVFVRAEEVGVGRGAGGDDAGDFAADEFLAGAGVFHLVTDRDAVAFADEARDVAFGGVIGHAAHGDGVAFFLVASGEGDFEFAGGKYGVVEKELVEVAEAEHEEGTWDLLLEGVILPHQGRSCRVGVHGKPLLCTMGLVWVGFVFSLWPFFLSSFFSLSFGVPGIDLPHSLSGLCGGFANMRRLTI